MALTRSAAAANAAIDAQTALVNNGTLRIYGTARPSNVATAVSGQTLLAELPFGATAFGASSGGVATANALTADAAANNGGTAVWFRAFAADGTTGVFDGSVGAAGSGADLIIDNVAISAGVQVSVTSMTLTGGLG